MIDKIDGGSPYDYPRITNKKVKGADAYDASYKVGRDSVSHRNTKENEEAGVILDLTAKKEQLPKSEYTKGGSESEESTGLTFAQIKKTVLSAIAFLKETWKMIWEDAPATDQSAKEKTEENISVSESERLQEEEDSENWAGERIKEVEKQKQVQMESVLKSRNLDSLSAILTENGKKRLAKNTTLLTTYDRRGRIVNVDETEKERILHGDKNFIKL